jgi:hypothetical protein
VVCSATGSHKWLSQLAWIGSRSMAPSPLAHSHCHTIVSWFRNNVKWTIMVRIKTFGKSMSGDSGRKKYLGQEANLYLNYVFILRGQIQWGKESKLINLPAWDSLILPGVLAKLEVQLHPSVLTDWVLNNLSVGSLCPGAHTPPLSSEQPGSLGRGDRWACPTDYWLSSHAEAVF